MSEKKIVEALAKAQSEFAPIPKDRVNPFFKSRYATLDAVNKATLPALSANGLAVTMTFCEREGKNYVVTSLRHVSGETIVSEVPIIPAENMQGLGSAITYARRYGLCGLLNVTADEDDDGNAASPRTTGKKSSHQQSSGKKTPEEKIKECKNAKGLLLLLLDWLAARPVVDNVESWKKIVPLATSHCEVSGWEKSEDRDKLIDLLVGVDSEYTH